MPDLQVHQTPEEFIANERARYETFEWILHLVPAGAGGTDLTRLPSEIEEQLTRIGIREGSPIERMREANRRIDWVRDEFAQLLDVFPNVRKSLASAGDVSAAAVNEAEFNGHVYRCKGGYAIIVPTGVLLLTSFTAELYGMFSTSHFQRTMVLGDKLLASRSADPWREQLQRAARLAETSGNFLALYPRQAGAELQILFRRYSDLGVSDPPDLIRAQSTMPLPPDPRRLGHPLEAGNHLRQLAIKFLMLHECAHIALNHFDGSLAQGTWTQEFDADLWAVRTMLESTTSRYAAAASVLGAWLLMTIARHAEAFDKAKSQTSHPPAHERIDNLWTYVRGTNLLGRASKRLALDCLEEAQTRQVALNRGGWEFREPRFAGGNALARFLSDCIAKRTLDPFLDQVARWLYQGAPSRLCHSLATARVELERKNKKEPKDEGIKLGLDAVMQVYGTADRHSNSVLKDMLQDAYWAALARPVPDDQVSGSSASPP
ncbi:hypothetical protein [Bradyrhizobium septentrionale]|uniref:Peptidase M48 domain-containing protein n=1 Tax=Bradyrhizobium septentrionale TaxID=1404411 RepID=A0ABZ2NTS4_9BRAD